MILGFLARIGLTRTVAAEFRRFPRGRKPALPPRRLSDYPDAPTTHDLANRETYRCATIAQKNRSFRNFTFALFAAYTSSSTLSPRTLRTTVDSYASYPHIGSRRTSKSDSSVVVRCGLLWRPRFPGED